ncbi:hypothetical protein DRO69_07140 [Candidatus Bathyarchaeota archaeon]|nr:MAG: hypothetical protein DRO69_07140 [Candidatus Bathyarchaeota archaeon]
MPRYKAPFDWEFKHFQLLAQRWAGKDKRLQDYACNILAPKLVVLDNYIDKLEDGEVKKRLEEVRTLLKRIGEVQWIQMADIVTNLALKVGKTTINIDVAKELGRK